MIKHKEEITNAFRDRFNEVELLFSDMDEQTYLYSPEGRWSSGQHLQHLILATKPIISAINLPKFALKYKFGLTNRETRSYNQVYNKYTKGLAAGYSAVESVWPEEQLYNKKSEKIKTFSQLGQKLIKVCDKWSEKDLDRFILPHPAMGKMPIREILFFTEFHTLHHINILKSNYINQ